jgi:cbb3-type cytochrome oxidase maturation protein
MLALFWLIPFTLVLGRAGWVLFASTVRSGQYDDLDAAAYRILSDDGPPP